MAETVVDSEISDSIRKSTNPSKSRRLTCCQSIQQLLSYRRFLQFHKDSREERSKWLCYLAIHYSIVFLIGPLVVLLIYLIFTVPIQSSNEYYDEYLLIPTIWGFLVFRTIMQEALKRRALEKSTFYQFPLSQFTTMPDIQKPLMRALYFYQILWFISSIVIGFTPCLIRTWNFLGIRDGSNNNNDNRDVCFYNGWHLVVILINIFGLLLFGYTLGNASTILSKRWQMGTFYAKKAIQHWSIEKQNFTFPSVAQVKKWHEFMLNISYPIQSIANRRVFISTMVTGLALPIFALIVLIAIPEAFEKYFVIIQFLMICAIFEITVLYSVYEAANMNYQWQKSVKEFSKWLFDPNYEKYLPRQTTKQLQNQQITQNTQKNNENNNDSNENNENKEENKDNNIAAPDSNDTAIFRSPSLLEDIENEMKQLETNLPRKSQSGPSGPTTSSATTQTNSANNTNNTHNTNDANNVATSVSEDNGTNTSTIIANNDKSDKNRVNNTTLLAAIADARQDIVIEVIDQVVWRGLVSGTEDFYNHKTRQHNEWEKTEFDYGDSESGKGKQKQGFYVHKQSKKVNLVEWGMLTQEYLPILNYWNRKYKGVSVIGIQVDFRLFWRLLSITLINIFIFSLESRLSWLD